MAQDTPDTLAADQAAFTNLYNQGTAWKDEFQWNDNDTFRQRTYQDPSNSKVRYREVNNHAQLGDRAENDYLIREDKDASGKWVATRAYSVAQDGTLQTLDQGKLKGIDQTYISSLQVNPAGVNPGQSGSVPHAEAPPVAALSTNDLKGLQANAGLTTDATGQWNGATQDKIHNLLALGQSSDAYTGKHDLIYGEKTQAALVDMEKKGQLSAEQLKTFHTLEAMNGGHARQTSRQLIASGYKVPDAQTAASDVAAARQKSDPIANAAAQEKQNLADEAKLKPIDASGMAGPQGMPLPAFGNRPNYAKVTLSTLTQNPAYQAATGHIQPGENVSVSEKNGMTTTTVKQKGHVESTYTVDKNGAQIATTTKNGNVTSQVVMEADGQVGSDQEMQKNAKGKQQLAQLVTTPMPGAAPDAKPPNAPVLADNNAQQKQQQQQKPGVKSPMLKV